MTESSRIDGRQRDRVARALSLRYSSRPVIVGVDASNVRAGGGITHLANVFAAAKPGDFGIDRVVVWAGRGTHARLPEAPWLEKVWEPTLDRPLPHRLLWQWLRLPRLAAERCDILFSPGGNAPRGFAPLVSLSQNMLPFEWKELSRYGLSLVGLRLLLLRFGQGRTFRNAAGVIFLTRYARDGVLAIAPPRGKIAIVPHGIEERFRAAPRPQRARAQLSAEHPLRLLYVSIIDVYKHQWHVAEAVDRLRREGLPVEIDFVGPAFPPALARFEAVRRRLDPEGRFLHYRGPVPFEELHELRERAEVFVFASSCENMPNVLVEGMASGFPIACAKRGPMPEILGDGGVYFDPEDPDSIAEAIRSLADDDGLRERCAARAYERAMAFSWERCARETLGFLREVAVG